MSKNKELKPKKGEKHIEEQGEKYRIQKKKVKSFIKFFRLRKRLKSVEGLEFAAPFVGLCSFALFKAPKFSKDDPKTVKLLAKYFKELEHANGGAFKFEPWNCVEGNCSPRALGIYFPAQEKPEKQVITVVDDIAHDELPVDLDLLLGELADTIKSAEAHEQMQNELKAQKKKRKQEPNNARH